MVLCAQTWEKHVCEECHVPHCSSISVFGGHRGSSGTISKQENPELGCVGRPLTDSPASSSPATLSPAHGLLSSSRFIGSFRYFQWPQPRRAEAMKDSGFSSHHESGWSPFPSVLSPSSQQSLTRLPATGRVIHIRVSPIKQLRHRGCDLSEDKVGRGQNRARCWGCLCIQNMLRLSCM